MFFVVSTGRSGTTSLAHLLDQSPDCVCVHEPEPKLKSEASDYLYGTFSHQQMMDLMQRTRSATIDGKQYGEVSLRLSTIIPVLREAFPEAKFVWLIRDGRDFVASAINWGFYSSQRTDDWEKGRVRANKLGLMTDDQWHSLSQFEKVCWHWDFINAHIEQELKRCGCDWHYIRVNDHRLEVGGLKPQG